MAEDVFLQPVADKFVRLVFQLLARYSSWLAEGLSGRASANAVTALQNGASQVSTCCGLCSQGTLGADIIGMPM